MNFEIPEKIGPPYLFDSYVGFADVSIMEFHDHEHHIYLPYWSDFV